MSLKVQNIVYISVKLLLYIYTVTKCSKHCIYKCKITYIYIYIVTKSSKYCIYKCKIPYIYTYIYINRVTKSTKYFIVYVYISVKLLIYIYIYIVTKGSKHCIYKCKITYIYIYCH